MARLRPVSLNKDRDSKDLLNNIIHLVDTNKARLIKGSLEPNKLNAVFAQFILFEDSNRWELSGLLDEHGGLTLRRI